MKPQNIISAVSGLLPYPPCAVLVWFTIQHTAKRWDLLYSRLKFLRRITFSTLLVKFFFFFVLNLVQNLKREDNDEIPFQVIYKVPSYELFRF